MYKSYARCQRAIVPGLRYSQYNYLDVLRREIQPNFKWLDIGCGHQLFGSWMTHEERKLASLAQQFIGIDLDEKSIAKHQTLHMRVVGSLEKLPFTSEIFDVVTANMVIEHILQPATVLAEVFRVLRNGGTFIFHTPNRNSFQNTILRNLPQIIKNKLALILEGRSEEDVFPAYYRLNTVEAIKKYSATNFFNVRAIHLFNSSAQTALLGPLSIPELLFLRILQRPTFEHRRTNIIAILSKVHPNSCPAKDTADR
jgi:ubiquinone/menaquinone biosynthesis C-methylase UbiE